MIPTLPAVAASNKGLLQSPKNIGMCHLECCQGFFLVRLDKIHIPQWKRLIFNPRDAEFWKKRLDYADREQQAPVVEVSQNAFEEAKHTPAGYLENDGITLMKLKFDQDKLVCLDGQARIHGSLLRGKDWGLVHIVLDSISHDERENIIHGFRKQILPNHGRILRKVLDAESDVEGPKRILDILSRGNPSLHASIMALRRGGSWKAIIASHCWGSLGHYLKNLTNGYWEGVMAEVRARTGNDTICLNDINFETFQRLAGLAPRMRECDANKVRQEFKTHAVFDGLDDQMRKVFEEVILQRSCMIPSLKLFFCHRGSLIQWSKWIKGLLGLSPRARDSAEEVLRDIYTHEQGRIVAYDIQISPDKWRSIPASFEDRRELSVRQLWLCVMRQGQYHKDHLPYLAHMAIKLGFATDDQKTSRTGHHYPEIKTRIRSLAQSYRQELGANVATPTTPRDRVASRHLILEHSIDLECRRGNGQRRKDLEWGLALEQAKQRFFYFDVMERAEEVCQTVNIVYEFSCMYRAFFAHPFVPSEFAEVPFALDTMAETVPIGTRADRVENPSRMQENDGRDLGSRSTMQDSTACFESIIDSRETRGDETHCVETKRPTMQEAVLAPSAQPDRSASSHHEVGNLNIRSSLEIAEETSSFMSAASSVSHAADETPHVGEVDGDPSDTMVLLGDQEISDTDDTTQQESLAGLPNAAQKDPAPAQQTEQRQVHRTTHDTPPAQASEKGMGDFDPQTETRCVIEKPSQEEPVRSYDTKRTGESHCYSTVMGPPARIQRLQRARPVRHPRRWAWSTPLTAKVLGTSSGRLPLHVIQRIDNLPVSTTAHRFGPSRGASVIPATKMPAKAASRPWPGLKHNFNNGRTILPLDAKRHSKSGYRVTLTAPNTSGDKQKVKVMEDCVRLNGLGTSSIMGTSHPPRDRRKPAPLNLCSSTSGKQTATNKPPISTSGKTSEGEAEAVQGLQRLSYAEDRSTMEWPRDRKTASSQAAKEATQEGNRVVDASQLESISLAQMQNNNTAFALPSDRLAGGEAEASLLSSLDTLPSQGDVPSRDAVPSGDAVPLKDAVPSRDAVASQGDVPSRDAVPSGDAVPLKDAVPSRDAVASQDAVVSQGDVPSRDAVASQGDVPSRDAVASQDAVVSQGDVPSRAVPSRAVPSKDAIPSRDAVASQGDVPSRDAVASQGAVASRAVLSRDAVASRAVSSKHAIPLKGAVPSQDTVAITASKEHAKSYFEATADRIMPAKGGVRVQRTRNDEAGIQARRVVDQKNQNRPERFILDPPGRAHIAHADRRQEKKLDVLLPTEPPRDAGSHPAAKSPAVRDIGRANRATIGNQLTRDTTEIVKLIGEGGFGKVWIVRRKDTGAILCRKDIYYGTISETQLAQVIAEVKYLRELQGNNHIVSYHGYEELKKEKRLHIYMEYCANGDLSQLIAQGTPISEGDVWKALHQIMLGLYRCHYGVNFDTEHIKIRPKSSITILHLDLKPANIFLDKDFVLKIGDFGLSEQRPTGHGFPCIFQGTMSYISPEMWKGEPVSTRSDIWSIGCVIYELCQRVPLFPKTIATANKPLPNVIRNRFPWNHHNNQYDREVTMERFRSAICKGRKISLSGSGYSIELQMVIQRCLEVDVDKRWDTHDLLVYLHERHYGKKNNAKPPPQPAQKIPEISPSAKIQKRMATPGRRGGLRALKAVPGGYVPEPPLQQGPRRIQPRHAPVVPTSKGPRGPKQTTCQMPNVPPRSPVPLVPSAKRPRNIGVEGNVPGTAILDAPQPAQKLPGAPVPSAKPPSHVGEGKAPDIAILDAPQPAQKSSLSSRPDLSMHMDVDSHRVGQSTEQTARSNTPRRVSQGERYVPTEAAVNTAPVGIKSKSNPPAETSPLITHREAESVLHARDCSPPVHAVQGMAPVQSFQNKGVGPSHVVGTPRSNTEVPGELDGNAAEMMISGERQLQDRGSNNNNSPQSQKPADPTFQVQHESLHNGTPDLIPASVTNRKNRLESSRSFTKTVLPANAIKRARVKKAQFDRQGPFFPMHFVYLECERHLEEPRIVSRVYYSYSDVLADVDDFLQDFPGGLIYNARLQQLGTEKDIWHHMKDTYRTHNECVLIFDGDRNLPHGAMQDHVMLNIECKITQRTQGESKRRRQRAAVKKLRALRMGPKLTVSERVDLEQRNMHAQMVMMPFQVYLQGLCTKGWPLPESSPEQEPHAFWPIHWQLRKARASKAAKRNARAKRAAHARQAKNVKEYDRKIHSLVKTAKAGRIVKRKAKVPGKILPAGKRRLRKESRTTLGHSLDAHCPASESL
ncbi:kinase-like domain-containing protein [Penicillium sp. IBT 35674x]|nr:kinase-like domain-containing protein [Penicillium sp. IBT 35674x]